MTELPPEFQDDPMVMGAMRVILDQLQNHKLPEDADGWVSLADITATLSSGEIMNMSVLPALAKLIMQGKVIKNETGTMYKLNTAAPPKPVIPTRPPGDPSQN